MQQLQQVQGREKTIRVIEGVAPEWEELAIAMGFEAHIITAIRRDNLRDAKAATRQILTRWLDGECTAGTAVSWESLVQYLDNAGFSGVAFDLQELF